MVEAVRDSLLSESEKRAAVDQLLSSHTLGRSEQLKAFLEYVCDSEIQGHGAELNEYLIGVQVLGRPEGYSTSDDASVRTRAHSLRRKILDYYSFENPNALLRIDLPKGSYCPQFLRNEPPSVPPAPIAQPTTRRLVPIITAAVALATVLLGAGYFLGAHFAAPGVPAIVREAWGPLLDSGGNTLICVATPFHLLIRPGPPDAASKLYRPIPDSPDISAWYRERQELQPGEKLFMNFGHNSPMFGDVASLLMAVRILDRAQVPYSVLPERVVTPFQMRNRSVLILGRPEYSHAARLMIDKAWFGIAYHQPADGMTVWYPNPTPDKPAFLYHPKDRYGLITVLPSDGDQGGRHRTIVISGSNSASAHGAAEFLSSPIHLAALMERFRAEGAKDWPRSWQVVVRSNSEQMLPMNVAYHSHRILSR